ncbi:T9SS type A sorting domain-containing protein [Neptunitalea lumnitzerae]|uniref:Secretion system C-terminal sorting domain-containing protein n=1 Tax=Neptunitalea lumnitzerae TaxID=2965509 RepID=A0ABQ5MML3_9FLAO|nr:T9SS type A sorting domain-containing protein [Neptunitalea sp. Y10]GLB50619.1 hypothetical protein Y10_29870 [Neptunitalea sp. Y10]
MKIKLLLAFALFSSILVTAQQAPVIDGDLLLCPYTDGTATVTNGETYETYQWYYKYWFLSDPYQAIPGATSETFTYDWYTYDQALLKLEVTVNGTTLESNEIQIDSYAWASLTVLHDMSPNITIDQSNGNFIMCDGDYITNTVQSPYTEIQWYKDNAPIPGANGTVYTITEPGDYYAVAAPSFCPNSTSTTVTFTAVQGPNCSLSTENPDDLEGIKLENNPVNEFLTISAPDNTTIENIIIYNMKGQQMNTPNIGSANTTVNVSALKPGIYIAQIIAGSKSKRIKFVKQ